MSEREWLLAYTHRIRKADLERLIAQATEAGYSSDLALAQTHAEDAVMRAMRHITK